MKDIYTETVVPIAPPPGDRTRQWVYTALLVTSAFMTLYAGLLYIILVVVFGTLLYRVIQRKDREYEYVHTNDVFDIDMVIRSSRRKTLVTVKLDEVILVAPSDSMEAGIYVGAKVHDYSGGNSGEGLYAMICARDGKYAKVILRLDRAMLLSLKQWVPERVKL